MLMTGNKSQITSHLNESNGARPDNVGIIGMDVYIPKCYVDQSELEEYCSYDKGKITVGLGQLEMAVCSDREDVNSISLTVVKSCLEKYNIPYSQIGRLEVGTETLIDKSKSVKSTLMQLFTENSDVEGTDVVNACYGGTNAVLNCVNWVESSNWDGRYALAVAADISVYDKGPARPSGGAAAVAILIGPNAPVVFVPHMRATHSEHSYDFYKPILPTEYPHVDGKFSLSCYYKAFDTCYRSLLKKSRKNDDLFHSVNDFDYLVFHSPFTKLVKKCVVRMPYIERSIALNDNNSNQLDLPYPSIAQFDSLPPELSYSDRSLEKALLTLDSESNLCSPKASLGLNVSKRVGNSYCASVWLCLASILSLPLNNDDPNNNDPNNGDPLLNKNILLFSYGSGLIASVLVLRVVSPLSQFRSALNIPELLASRTKISPSSFESLLNCRQKTFLPDYTPSGIVSGETLFNNTFYLDSIDSEYRRSYKLFQM